MVFFQHSNGKGVIGENVLADFVLFGYSCNPEEKPLELSNIQMSGKFHLF